MSSTILQNPPLKKKTENRVLDKDFRKATNFFVNDRIFNHYIKKRLSPAALEYMTDKLMYQGKESALRMDDLAMLADKNGPELVKRNNLGETINEIRFHPAYDEMLRIAVKSEMFRVKWEPGLRKRFDTEKQKMGFASGYLFAMAEMGQFCPLCMTDGVARLIDLFVEGDDRERLLKHIATNNPEELFTGAMFLTEKSGGSDVGANLVKATQLEGKTYLLNGEKWFCSNANAEIIFVLARTNEKVSGIRGLSIFLVEKHLKDGSRNPMNMIRLKEKMGVRSMASAEIILTDTVGTLIGNEFEGFPVMAEMINLSRIYTAIGSLSGARRALSEAYQFLNHRSTFGKTAIEHPLVRKKLEQLGAMQLANFYSLWRAVDALDKAENGDKKEANLLRLLTPMVKKSVSETSVYIARESMELMGGLGYIEDTIIPRIFRDLNVNPIWEGSGNIMVLDMLRAVAKSDGLRIMLDEIQQNVNQSELADVLFGEVAGIEIQFDKLFTLPQDEMECTAAVLFDKLTLLYSISLIAAMQDDESREWIRPALVYFREKYEQSDSGSVKPPSSDSVRNLIGWDY